MMKLNLFINAKETESYIDIHAPKMNDRVQSIINAVNDLDKSHTLVGYIDKEIHIINVSDVITFQVINKNVTAITSNQKFKLKLRLYELENSYHNISFAFPNQKSSTSITLKNYY